MFTPCASSAFQAAEDASPSPHLPPSAMQPAAAPHLRPLPCVRPSRCSRAASTSFTHRHRAPGESQPSPWSTDNRRVRAPQPPQSRPGARVVAVLPCGTTHSLLPHVSAALHSREALTNEAPGAGERKTRAGQSAAVSG